MGEGLRKVALLASSEANPLSEQPEVIGIGGHLLEDQTSLLDSAGAGERIHIPVRGNGKRALMATQAVRRGTWIVAIHQAVRDKLVVHRLQRSEPERVLGRDKAD